MTRYLPLVVNLGGLLLIFIGVVGLIVVAFQIDFWLGWGGIFGGLVFSGVRLAQFEFPQIGER